VRLLQGSFVSPYLNYTLGFAAVKSDFLQIDLPLQLVNAVLGLFVQVPKELNLPIGYPFVSFQPPIGVQNVQKTP
jgi:hypothetical protein